MFDNLYPSADGTVSGLVTLLAAAHALRDFSQSEAAANARPILYTFFNGVRGLLCIGCVTRSFSVETGQHILHSKHREGNTHPAWRKDLTIATCTIGAGIGK